MTSETCASFDRVTATGERHSVERAVAVECPVALEFNGVGYAVLMATPNDLPDLALGFALSERLVRDAADVLDIDTHETERGIIVRVGLAPQCQGAIEARVRHRVTESSCGLCGIENLEQALRPLPRVTAISRVDDDAIFHAVAALGKAQPVNRRTGAMHAAALCAADGTPSVVREDVGRHNAFDKLIGAMAREGRDWGNGFALLTSRCSYELVEKAALANCPMLVTLSAPTSLALERARDANLPLIVLARDDAILMSRIEQHA